MSSFEDMKELYEIVGIEIVPDDLIIPDSKPHIIYLRSISPEFGAYWPVPMLCTGAQWDLMYWTFRLSGDERQYPLYLGELLVELQKAKRGDTL